MNRRTEEEYKFIDEYLDCEIAYEHVSNGIDMYATPSLAGVELDRFKVHFYDRKDDEQALQVKTDMTIGRLNKALKDIVVSGKASPLRDKMNQGFNNIRLHAVPDKQDKVIEDFKNKDFRAEMTLVEMKFTNIEVRANIDEQSLTLFYVDGNKGVEVTNVDRNSNVVNVVNSFKEKANFEVSPSFVTALRNQIREFKELFAEDVHDEVAERRKKELQNGK